MTYKIDVMVKYLLLPKNDYYRVGNDGSAWCRKLRGKYERIGPWRKLKPWKKDKYGHLCFYVCRNGYREAVLLSPLILRLFRGEPPAPKLECCHIDGDPSNNQVENLKWGTRKQNAADMVRHGRSTKGKSFGDRKAVKLAASKLDEEKVRAIVLERRAGATMRFLADKFRISLSAVNDIDKGRTWKEVSRD